MNIFTVNSLEENITIIISHTFRNILDKTIRGFCPYVKVDTFFVSNEEAKYYSWENGWEVGSRKLDLTGKTDDFIANGDEEGHVGEIPIENARILLNAIVGKWETHENDENPVTAIADVQYAGKVKEYDVYIVPISFKNQWDNTIIISYLFSSFAKEWVEILPIIEAKIKKYKNLEDVKNLFNEEEIVKNTCIRRVNELFNVDEGIRDVYNVISSLAIQTYESQGNCGTLAIVEDEDIEKGSIVKYAKPIPMTFKAIRQIRKVLEIANSEWDILVSKERIIGMGKNVPNRGKIVFIKPGCWNVVINNEIQFSATANRFSIVVSPEDVPFREKFIECFNKSGKWDVIERIIKDAQEQKHGTTIIVSDAAKKEAKRLCNLGYGIAVSPFSGDSISGAIKAATAIDGAVLVDRKGVCYAIGVILDGKAQIEGNPARGARYNSVRNYLTNDIYVFNGVGCMAIIISEDGSTDVITSEEIKSKYPELMGNG